MPTMTPEQKAAYVAGFFDGEGHISCYPTARGNWIRNISFCNTDRALVETVGRYLNDLGLKTRAQFNAGAKDGWADRWTVYIAEGRQAFERFRALIPIQAPAKVETLDRLLANYSDPEAVRLARRNGEERPCEVCGEPVYASAVFLARGGGRFCSVACRGMAQRKRVGLLCQVCGKPFHVIEAKAATAKFCSRGCFGRSQSDRLSGMARMAAQARWHR